MRLFRFGLLCGALVSSALAADLEDDARELGAALGIPVRVERAADPSPRTVLWLGPEDAPSIAVVDRRGAGPDDAADRALQVARTLGAGLASEGVSLDFALAFVVESSPSRHGPAVEFDRNFPTRWSAARALHGAAAGLYPGERGDVASWVDWALDPRRAALLGVVVLEDAGAAADPPRVAPAGSLRAFVEESLARRYERAHAPREVLATARSLHASGRGLGLRALDVRPMGGEAWVADLHLGWARRDAPSAPSKDTLACRLELRTEGAGDAWLACAVESEGGTTFRVVPLRAGAVRVELPPGGRRVRLFVHTAEDAGPGFAVRVRAGAPGLVPTELVVPFHEAPRGADPGEPPAAKAPVAEGPVAKGPVAKGPVAKGPVAKGPVAKGPAAKGND